MGLLIAAGLFGTALTPGIGLSSAFADVLPGEQPPTQTVISATDAYSRVRRDGALKPRSEEGRLVLTEEFDLGDATAGMPGNRRVALADIDFRGGLALSAEEMTVGLHFVRCYVTNFFASEGSIWNGNVEFDDAEIAGLISLERSEFKGRFTLRNSTSHSLNLGRSKLGSLDLRGTKVERADLVGIAVTGDAQFDRMLVGGQLSLRGAVFGGNVSFEQGRFNGDVNFDGVALKTAPSFRNGQFATLYIRGLRRHGALATEILAFEHLEVSNRLCLDRKAAETTYVDWTELSAAVLACDPKRATLIALRERARGRGDADTTQQISTLIGDNDREESTLVSRTDEQAAESILWRPLVVALLAMLVLALLVIYRVVRGTRRRQGTINLFISYRRSETWAAAQAIRKDLLAGGCHVFLDVTNLALGAFGGQVEHAVKHADAVLVIMHESWALDSDDSTGEQRLKQADDWIRREVAWALEAHRLLVPVLVGDARMPNDDELPKPLRGLLQYQAARLRSETWDADASRLLAMLHEAVTRHSRSVSPASSLS